MQRMLEMLVQPNSMRSIASALVFSMGLIACNSYHSNPEGETSTKPDPSSDRVRDEGEAARAREAEEARRAALAEAERRTEEAERRAEEAEMASYEVDRMAAEAAAERLAAEAAAEADRLASEAEIEADPVYNIVFHPLENHNPIVLPLDIASEMTFSIGEPSEFSILRSPITANPSLDYLADNEPIDLNVTVNCAFCKTKAYQRQVLSYSPALGRSINNAVFTIDADLNLLDTGTGAGTIIIAIDARGIDLDVLQVPVFLGKAPEEIETSSDRQILRRLHHASASDNSKSDTDLTIDITDAPDWMEVTLIAHNEELRRHLVAAFDSDDDIIWTFKSGVTRSDLEDLVRSAYFEQRSLIDQNETNLQRVYERLGRRTRLSANSASLNISNEDREAMIAVLRRHGKRLYNRVFLGGDRQLNSLMRALMNFKASASEEPLKLRLRSSSVYAPWQLMYTDDGTHNVRGFWGFRYQMGTTQLVDTAQSSLTTSMSAPTGQQTLFVAYRGNEDEDPVSQRALMFSNFIGELLQEDIPVTNSKAAFLSKLFEDGPNFRFIVAYGHASNGSVVSSNQSGAVVVNEQVLRQRFMFTREEFLDPLEIDDIAPLPGDGLLLDSQPFVIFNACETGSGGNGPNNNNTFVGALTRAGARVVIVTETPVWNNFAYHFGKDLVKNLLDGKTAQSALYDARIRHLEKWNNPLGLVYTLYGNPSARILDDM